VADFLEQTLVGHILLLFPLLIGIGFFIGSIWRPNPGNFLDTVNQGGIAGIVLVSFSAAFWMIPRWLDASLDQPVVATMKYFSLICLIGIPIAWSWDKLHSIARGLVKIEFLSMLLRLGWLYLISPIRLCNSYLLADQFYLAWGMLITAFALAITWVIPVFFGPWESIWLKTSQHEHTHSNPMV
jgi:hypothetical protein